MLFHFPHYFSHRVNREVKEVYFQTFLANFALALVFIFEPIYLHTLNYSFTSILWFYLQVYVWYAILVSFGAKFASSFGYKHSIFLSNIFYIMYWVSFYFIRDYSVLFYVVPVLFAMQKSLLWPAYNADVALFDNKQQSGREVGVLFSMQEVAFIIAPLIGGLVSAKFGFFTLFVLASVVMFLSIIPLFQTPDTYPRHDFNFRNLLKIWKLHPRNFFGYWGYAEDLMVMSLWPIYMFIVVSNFSGVGLISAIAMFIATMVMLYIGKQSDRISKPLLIRRDSFIYGLSWIFRFLASTTPLVLLFDVITKVLKAMVTVPEVAFTYNMAGGKGPDYAIAYSVFFEFSLAIGKIVTALGAILILTYSDNIFLVFGFVGIMTMFYGLLRKKK